MKTSELILDNLKKVQGLIESSNENQCVINDVYLKNFERFAERITKIEIALFGKSED